MPVSKRPFSKDGSTEEYVLVNDLGSKLQITNWGARVTRFIVKDKAGVQRDVVAGFESYEEWQDSLSIDDPYFGATVGRVAGRISPCHDIKIGPRTCSLPATQPHSTCLHGGKEGFDKKVFEGKIVSQSPASVMFTYVSEDGQEGFPGQVQLSVTYTLAQDKDAMSIEYKGKSMDGIETILNPTNHTYWNLTGFVQPTIENHMCQLSSCADRVMVTLPDNPSTPSGELETVVRAGLSSPLDFVTKPCRYGDRLKEFGPETPTRGIDHAFVTSLEPTSVVRDVGQIWSEFSGIRLTVATDQPLLVMYTGNWISDKLVGKYGVRYRNYAAVALETQGFLNAVNIPRFYDQVKLAADDVYTHRVEYKLDIFE